MFNFSAPLDKLRIVNVGESRGPGGCLLEAINGNMVYLCYHDPEDVAEERLEYLGLGLVRALDEQKVYLVSGINRKHLGRVNCLALTSIPLPMQVLMSQNTAALKGSSTVPYICQADSQSIVFRNIIDRPFRTEAASKR